MRTVFLTHTSFIGQRTLIWCLACCVNVLLASSAAAQSGRPEIEYTVKVADIQGQLFHVTTDIKNINQPSLERLAARLSPGWYVIENYAKERRFAFGCPHLAAASCGLRRGVSRPGKSTRRGSRALSSSSITLRSALRESGAHRVRLRVLHRHAALPFARGPSIEAERVRFNVPAGWKIASGLDETADPMVFTAPDYDTLVDQPTLMGQFDVIRFTADGNPPTSLSIPRVCSRRRRRARWPGIFRSWRKRRAGSSAACRTGICVLLFLPARRSECAVLEHQNSFVALWNPDALPLPDDMVGQASHEFFHVWNVKRIRPVQMWPYDYSRENETPLLWVSEGFAWYYPGLTLYRAGLRDARSFIGEAARAIGEVEGNEARRYISASDASTSTSLGYDGPAPFSLSYYSGAEHRRAPRPLHSS